MNFPLKLVITSTPFRKEGTSLKLKESVSEAPALIKELQQVPAFIILFPVYISSVGINLNMQEARRHYQNREKGIGGNIAMSYIVGIAWFKDEATYQRAREVFIDSGNLPATYEGWKALVERQVELIKDSGNMAIRADIDPEAFVSWCASRGIEANSQARRDFVKHVEIEYQKTGKGTVID